MQTNNSKQNESDQGAPVQLRLAVKHLRLAATPDGFEDIVDADALTGTRAALDEMAQLLRLCELLFGERVESAVNYHEQGLQAARNARKAA